LRPKTNISGKSRTINGRARERGSVLRNKLRTPRKTAPKEDVAKPPVPANAFETLKRFCTPPNSGSDSEPISPPEEQAN
jgi:hypothetical protein